MANKYLFGKGRMFLASRTTGGARNALFWVGNVASMSVALESDVLVHTESYTGKNQQDLRIVTQLRSNFTARVESFDIDILALALYGSKVTVSGASITAEVLPTVVLNDQVATLNPKISTVVIKDSAGTPATLVLDTNYSILDATTGRIQFINLGAFTQPFKIDYAYAARKDLGIFTTTAPERWLRFEGINLATDTKVVAELYKCRIDPMSELPLISDNAVGGYDMKGSALLDDTKSETAALGQFGTFLDLAA